MFGGDMDKRIFAAVTRIEEKVNRMSIELDTLVARVTEIESVGDSAIVLLGDLKTKLDEAIASDDKDALVALSERLGAQTQELADAISANTPAA
jgi:regulator of replication initiation timing